MTSFCIAASSVSHSLIETGFLWSLSLTKERLLEPPKVHFDEPLHRFLVGEADVVEKTAPQKRVGQLLFVVRGDEDDGALRCLPELPSFVHEELHPAELARRSLGNSM